MKCMRRCVRTHFSALILALVPLILPAQVPDPGILIDYLDVSPMEYYLDKADRQDMEDHWMRFARYGLEAALSSWETETRLLMGEDFDLSAFKMEAEEALEDRLRKRFALWLSNTFFSKLTPPSLAELSEEIAGLNEKYLYEKDEKGELVLDNAGNAVYKTSVDFKNEKDLWSDEVTAVIEGLVLSWNQRMITSGDELLSSVTDPELKGYIEQARDCTLESWGKNYRKELYRLYYLEQNRFVRLRLYDQRSLEKNTEQKTAEYISNQLITQTEKSLNAGLENLMTGLEARATIPSEEKGEVNSEKWMEAFRSLLESGLMAWDKAEEELLMERIQWEQISGMEILEAEEAWAESFNVIREKRSEWMNSYRQALEEGNRLWLQENESLELMIQNAVAELDAACENEKVSLKNRIDNLIGMLLQSVNMMRTARSSWEYWMDQIDGGGMGSFDSSLIAFDAWDMRRAGLNAYLDDSGYEESKGFILYVFDRLKESRSDYTNFWEKVPSDKEIEAIFNTYTPFHNLGGEEKRTKLIYLTATLEDIFTEIGTLLDGTHSSTGLKEAFYWVEEVFSVYQRYAKDAQDTLAATYGIVVFNDESMRTAFNDDGTMDELLMASGETSEGKGLLQGNLLYENALWEQLYLDPYQVEILKARAYMQYWQKQMIIADSVYNYAIDHSSTKEEAIITEKRLSEAKNKYEADLDNYRMLIERLEELGSDLEERGSRMATLQQQITEAQEELTTAREGLARVFGDLGVNNPQFLAEQYRVHYVELLTAYGMYGEEDGGGLGKAFEEYLLAAKAYHLEEEISLVSSRILNLVGGEENQMLGSSLFNPEAASLSVLHRRVTDSLNAGFTTDRQAAKESGVFFMGERTEYEYDCYLKDTLHLTMNDYRYERMLDLYDRYFSADTTEAGVILWQMQRIVRDIQIGMQKEYELRLARIRLLTCDSFEDWVDMYYRDLERDGTETTGELFANLTEDKSRNPLETILFSVGKDADVYEKILEKYHTYISGGGEGNFSLYTWNPDLLSGGTEILHPNQGMQRLWEYRMKASGGDEAKAAEEISRIIGALGVLRDFLAGLGSLEEHPEKIEQGLLYGHYLDEFMITEGIPEGQRNTFHFLKIYLNGGSALVTDEENLGSYFRMEESVAAARKESLLSLIVDSQAEAPVLRSITREEAYNSLLNRLIENGLVKKDGISLKRPETIWTEKNFSSFESVVPWLAAINKVLDNHEKNIPSYVYEELAGYLGELKTYISIKTMQAWPDDITLDLEEINKGIQIWSDESRKMKALLDQLITAGKAGKIGALWAIIELSDEGDPLYVTAAGRFIETIGFDLAYRASLDAEFSGTKTEWEDLYTEYLYDINLEVCDGIDSWRNDSLEAAMESYELAEAVSRPEEVDWLRVPDEWRDIYLAGLWNSLDFEAAALSLSGLEAVIDTEEFERRVTDLVALSRKPEGRVYANILKFGLNASLREKGGYTATEAEALAEGFLNENQIVADDERTIDEYMAVSKNSRLLWILKEYPGALKHYLKKLILNQDLEKADIPIILKGIESEGLLNELEDFLDIFETVRSYSRVLHGDMAAWLKKRYPGDDTRQLEVRAAYERFMGSKASSWDDPVFTIACGLKEVKVSEIIESIACNRTKSYSDILDGYNGSLLTTGTQSVNGVFLNKAAETIIDRLSDPERASRLAELYASKEFILRAEDWKESLETEDDDHWRTFLTGEYLASKDDTSDLISDVAVNIYYEDYGRDLIIGDEEKDTALAEYTSVHPFHRAGSEEKNFLLDAANSCLDRAAFFVGALEMWKKTRIAEEPKDDVKRITILDRLHTNPEETITLDEKEYQSVWDCLESIDYYQLGKAILYEKDTSITEAYNQGRTFYKGLLSRITGLKNSLGLLGKRREIVQRLAEAGEDEISKTLMPLREEISSLEAEIEDSQQLWQDLLDRKDGGYRQLEQEYADIYRAAAAAFDKVENTKQEYLLARAIYDYATAGYIDSGDGEQDQVTEDIPEEMIRTINNVSPAERRTYVDERLIRATAAYDALITIVNGNIETKYNIYERDPVYRSHFDAYLTSFRESMVLNKMNRVLNKALAGQQSVTRKALEDWNTARRESYVPISIRDVEGEIDISDLKDKGFGLDQGSGKSWSLTWGNGDLTNDEATSYFEIGEDSERNTSAFEDDLVRWLSVINNVGENNSGELEGMMEKWGMALLWEEYQEQCSGEDFDQDDFFSYYLNGIGEEDLDRTGAKELLLSRWEEAYNTRAEGLENGQWMYDFYKLLDLSGSMSIETEKGNGKADFSDFAEKESFILANEYMAAGKKEEGRRLILSSIPVFAMAAVYYAMALSAASILPFGWIAAIPLLAAFCALMVKGADLSGEGNMLKEAARKIETLVTNTEKQKDIIFADFKTDTNNLIQKQEIYEVELAKLNAMQGKEKGNESLNDEERVVQLKKSVIDAFKDENEDIGFLLKQAGLLTKDDNEEDPETISIALDKLFGLYQERMSESEKMKASNSHVLISALEREAFEKKQEAAKELNISLVSEDGSANTQNKAYEAYRQAYADYICGVIERDEFEHAVATAFANPSFSIREHLLRLFEQQRVLAKDIMGDDQFCSSVSTELLAEQEALLTGTKHVKGILDYRHEAYRDVRLFELSMLRTEMAERRKLWENQMSAIIAKGQMEWTDGIHKMRSRYETWIADAKRIYNNQVDSWRDKYLDFLSDKQTWMNSVSVQSTRYGDIEALKNFGELTRSAIDAAGEDVLIGDFMGSVFNPGDIISEVINFEALDTLLNNAMSVQRRIGSIESAVVYAEHSDRFAGADAIQDIKDFQNLKNEEFEQHLAQVELRELIERMTFAEERFFLRIEKANKSVKKGLHETMQGDGYVLEGNVYKKDLVVGATLREYLEDTGTVRRYRYYEPEEFDFSSELKAQESSLHSMDSKTLEGILDKAIASMREKTEEIFGNTEDPTSFLIPPDLSANKGTHTDIDGDVIDEESYDYLQAIDVFEEIQKKIGEKTERVFENDSGRWINTVVPIYTTELVKVGEKFRGVNMSPGLFGEHVGYAPGFSKEADIQRAWDADGQIEFPGLGELGEILGQFVFNKIREGYGWSEVNSPHYKKKLWDDTDGWIDAPSIQDITELSTTALSVTTGGTGAFLLGLTDDAVFTSADVGEGLMTWDEGLVDFGKSAVSSAVSSFMPGMGNEGMSPFEAALATLGNRLTLNTAIGAIQSITYSSGGEFSFDNDTFAKSLVGKAAIARYANTLLTSSVSGTMDSYMDGIDAGFLGSIADLGGDFAGSAAEYLVYAGFALSDNGFEDIGEGLYTAFDDMGGVSLNIANLGALIDIFRDISVVNTDNYNDSFLGGVGKAAENLAGTGIFSLNLGSGGIRGKITTEGINLGGSLYEISKGLLTERAIDKYSDQYKNGDLLRYGFAYGDQTLEDTILRILKGQDSITYGAGEGEAATTKTKEGGRRINFSSSYQDITDKEELLKIITILQHEAHRNGYVTEGNTEETCRAVLAHSNIAIALAREYGPGFILEDETLKNDMMTLLGLNSRVGSFKEYVSDTYDSGGDFWRLTLDNRLIWDDSRNLNVEYIDPETGEVKIEQDTRIDKTGSFSRSLMNFLGKEKAQEILESRGVDIQGLTDSEIAYTLMTSSGAEWNTETGSYVPVMLPGGQGYNMADLSDRLLFEINPEKAFHMKKISQETPSIAHWVGEGQDRMNAMALTGCYYLSTLGAVQTQAGVHLTSDQINRITEISLDRGWLKADETSIATQGNKARTEISRLAFEMLGIPASLNFIDPQRIDGFINIGETMLGNNHATEWGSMGLLFDPYEGINYAIPSFEDEILKYEYEKEFQEYYWREYESIFR